MSRDENSRRYRAGASRAPNVWGGGYIPPNAQSQDSTTSNDYQYPPTPYVQTPYVNVRPIQAEYARQQPSQPMWPNTYSPYPPNGYNQTPNNIHGQLPPPYQQRIYPNGFTQPSSYAPQQADRGFQNGRYAPSSKTLLLPFAQKFPLHIIAVGVLAILGLITLIIGELWLKWLIALLAVCAVIWVWLSSPSTLRKTALVISITIAILLPLSAMLNITNGDPEKNPSTPSFAAIQANAQPSPTVPSMLMATQTPIIESSPPQTVEPTLTPTPAPSPTVKPTEKSQNVTHDGVALDMALFYNTDGGSYYHTRADCSAVNSKYLPLTGTLVYNQLTESKYKKLKPCTSCSAPARPHSH